MNHPTRLMGNVLSAMRTGARLLNTPMGPCLVDERPTAFFNGNVHYATFRALVKRKLIEPKEGKGVVREWILKRDSADSKD